MFHLHQFTVFKGGAFKKSKPSYSKPSYSNNQKQEDDFQNQVITLKSGYVAESFAL